ncbi:hypothetical protein LCGC14_0884820 [marine sediment metagenome]|uniref:Uncharacterized protein n=1 Tax=marine sediment metagenome TaxID=412755 RepID=A0A0F9P0Y4_9ZZZZ
MNSKSSDRVSLAVLKAEEKELKQRLHDDLNKKHRQLFIFMDILIVAIILFNFGAVVITNVIAMKVEPKTVEILEVNPVRAEITGLELHEDWKPIFFNFILTVGGWFLIIWAYVYHRRRVYTNTQLTLLLAIVIGYSFLFGLDFFNNFGYLIGGLVYG